MSKRVEVMVRMSNGAVLFWDAALPVELPEAVTEALTPHRRDAEILISSEDRVRAHKESRAQFLETAGRLWDRVMTKVL